MALRRSGVRSPSAPPSFPKTQPKQKGRPRRAALPFARSSCGLEARSERQNRLVLIRTSFVVRIAAFRTDVSLAAHEILEANTDADSVGVRTTEAARRRSSVGITALYIEVAVR